MRRPSVLTCIYLRIDFDITIITLRKAFEYMRNILTRASVNLAF
jgi:hypothetical protein